MARYRFRLGQDGGIQVYLVGGKMEDELGENPFLENLYAFYLVQLN